MYFSHMPLPDDHPRMASPSRTISLISFGLNLFCNLTVLHPLFTLSFCVALLSLSWTHWDHLLTLSFMHSLVVMLPSRWHHSKFLLVFFFLQKLPPRIMPSLFELTHTIAFVIPFYQYPWLIIPTIIDLLHVLTLGISSHTNSRIKILNYCWF